jgi:hypothetical protein
MHDRIHDELRAARVVGRFFRSSLDIPPLPEVLTIRGLEWENLADLHKAYRAVKDLPSDEVAIFFNQFDVAGQQNMQQCVHFLV